MKIRMTEDRFTSGYEPDEYLNNLRNYRSFVRKLDESVPEQMLHTDELKAAVAQFDKPVRATMMSEDWCGDAACNFPLLKNALAAAGIPLRVFRGSETIELKEMYESEGDDHIPVFSFWDAEGAEIARWIEAPETIDAKKAAWKEERPAFMDLYNRRNEDKEAAQEFAGLYRELLDTMGEWYRSGDWNETMREVIARLNTSAR